MPKSVAGAIRASTAILYQGRCFMVELVLRQDGGCPAQEFLDRLPPEKRAKILALIRRLADDGRIANRQKFKKIEDTDFFEFKGSQTRVVCYFLPERRLVITHGFIKKQDRIPAPELRRAARLRAESDQR